METIFVTGANRGLGLAIIKKLAKLGRYNIASSARNVTSMQHVLQQENILSENHCLDLMKTTPKALESMLLKTNPSAVIHCASPYMSTPIIQASHTELKDYAHCMLLDQVLLNTFIKQKIAQKKRGILIYTGAVIGRSHFHKRGLMGLLKSHQRRLCEIAHYECETFNAPVFIRHLDLGSFRDSVTSEDMSKFIKTSNVVDTIIAILEKPEAFPMDIPLASEENERTYGLPSTKI